VFLLTHKKFLISNFHQILNVICFLLGDLPAYELYMSTFRNTLSVPSSYPPMKMELTKCSKMFAYKHHMLVNHIEESIQHIKNCNIGAHSLPL
jgi:hypothetical protein